MPYSGFLKKFWIRVDLDKNHWISQVPHLQVPIKPLKKFLRAVHSGVGAVTPGRKTIFFSNMIVLDFSGLFSVAILVQNLYTGDPCEGMWSLHPQTKNPRYGPVSLGF